MTTDITSLEIGSARKRALFSVSLNLALAVVKGIFGLMAGSTALIGDALHSATDVFASGAAFIGLWLAGKRHPSFPFGLYKAENIATLVISVFIMLVAYEIGRGAILGPKRMPDVALALPVAAATFVVALAFGLYQLRWGRRLGSPSLVADARDYLADSLSTGLVILGLAAESFGIPLERFAAFGVALFVFWSGGRIMVGSLRDLLDAAIDSGMQKDITSLVSRHPQVKSVERLIGRTAGSRILLNLDVLLRTESHEVADKIADRLEEEIRENFPRVVMVHIRTHFAHGETYRRMTPLNRPDGEVAEHLARAPWFLLEVFENESGGLVEKQHFENPYADKETKRGLLTGQWIMSFNPDEVRVRRVHTGTAIYLLQEAGVKVKEIHEGEEAESKTGGH